MARTVNRCRAVVANSALSQVVLGLAVPGEKIERGSRCPQRRMAVGRVSPLRTATPALLIDLGLLA